MKHDLLVWVEILELASNGEYLPVMVERNPDLACRSEFILRQGLQRRIRITLVHEMSDDLIWNDVRELVVGRIRTESDHNNASLSNADDSDDQQQHDMSVVSLGLFPGEVLEFPGDTRHFYRFEAAWDSSLHNSLLLNRVTPSGEHIYLTMSAYVQLDNCEQLSVITKDLCVTILGRDARTGTRSLKVQSLNFPAKKKFQIFTFFEKFNLAIFSRQPPFGIDPHVRNLRSAAAEGVRPRRQSGHPAASEARDGHERLLRPRRGEPGRLAAARRFAHLRPPMGIGEIGASAGGRTDSLLAAVARAARIGRRWQ